MFLRPSGLHIHSPFRAETGPQISPSIACTGDFLNSFTRNWPGVRLIACARTYAHSGAISRKGTLRRRVGRFIDASATRRLLSERPQVQSPVMPDDGSKDLAGKQSSAPPVPAKSFWEHPLTITFISFLLTGILGASITYYVQRRNAEVDREATHYESSTSAIASFRTQCTHATRARVSWLQL
jgi:hypothetical protein